MLPLITTTVYTVIGLYVAGKCVGCPLGQRTPRGEKPALFVIAVLLWLPVFVIVLADAVLEYAHSEPLDTSDDPTHPEDARP